MSSSIPATFAIGLVGAYVAAITVLSTTIYSIHIRKARVDFAGTDFTTITCIGILWTSVGYYLILAHFTSYAIAAITFGTIALLGGFIAAGTINKAIANGAIRHTIDASVGADEPAK